MPTLESSPFSVKAFNNIAQDLLGWYKIQARVLPWRAPFGENAPLYAVLISEFMLQQTTVATVGPYYQRFMDKFPTLEHLANSSLEELMVLWQGLGYYSRARNLHKASQVIKHNGWPQTLEGFLSLPGVGPYTARALFALGLGGNALPVDGNVVRLFGRLWAINENKDNTKKMLFQFFDGLEQIPSPGDLAQSMMDFANLVCKAKNPLCHECILQNKCHAFKMGSVFERDGGKSSPPKKQKKFGLTYITRNEEGFIKLNLGKGPLLKDLYGPPLSMDLDSPAGITKPDVRHIFTHIDLSLWIQKGGEKELEENEIWVNPKELHLLPLSTLAKKILKKAGILE